MHKQTSHLAPGFSLLELLVVISIIGLLASIVTSVFSAARAQANDSRRLTDMEVYAKAVEGYHSETATYFISSEEVGGCSAAFAAPQPPGHIYSQAGPGCVGAWGNSVGLMTAKGADFATSGYNPNVSIADVLIQYGYLPKILRDPQAASLAPDGSGPYPDYYYAICDDAGQPASSIRQAKHYSVRAALQLPTNAQIHNEQLGCGGIASIH